MNKPVNPYIAIFSIVAALVLVGVLTYFVHKWLQDKKDKKEQEAAGELAVTTTAGKDADQLSKTKAIKDAQIAAAKKMDVIKIGDMIYGAKGVANDEEEDVYSAFALIPNKFGLSLFVDYWKAAYKTDLFSFLRSFLNDEELSKVNTIVQKLK